MVDTRGNAAGVAYVDRTTFRSHEAHARAVVLCASTIESTRLLLNSASRHHPRGLANSSGLVGCYLMDHVQMGIAGHTVACDDETHNPNGIYVPQFRNTLSRESRFVRGYGIQGGVPRAAPARSFRSGLRASQRNVRPFWMTAFGEMLPVRENRITVRPDRKDAWGVPVPHIECRHGENEIEMAHDAAATLREMASAAEFEVTHESSTLDKPGLAVHEVGTARMGSDPKSSVLNGLNQSWDVANLFVTDGSSFVSQGFQNPTLTMMALTGRACDFLARELHKGAF
jgi:choline dehydrogenase-like flavoprotein